MPVIQQDRLARSIIDADRAALVALKNLPGYAPVSQDLSVEAMIALEARLKDAEEQERLAINALKAARDARDAAGYALHNGMIEIKVAVRAQFGANSDALSSMGLKKRDDYRRRSLNRPDKPS